MIRYPPTSRISAIAPPKITINAGKKIDWSTDKVFEQVLRNASDIGMSVGVLKESFDVDTLDDLTLLKEKYGYVI